MVAVRGYEEIIEFLAAGPSPQSIVDYHPSEETRARAFELVRREKEANLSPDEVSELQSFLHLEHIMRVAKAKARQRLAL